MTGACVCSRQVKARARLKALSPTHHIPSWQPHTQHRVVRAINKAGRTKTNFFFGMGQFSWYYPPKEISKHHFRFYLLQLWSPLAGGSISSSSSVVFLDPGVSQHAAFKHLPFKGRGKTDGHKNISEAKYTMQNDSWYTAKNDGKGEEAGGMGSGGCRPFGKVSRLLPDRKCPWHTEGAQAGGTGAVKAKSTTRFACFGMWGFTDYKSREFTELFLWLGWSSNKWLGYREETTKKIPNLPSKRENQPYETQMKCNFRFSHTRHPPPYPPF